MPLLLLKLFLLNKTIAPKLYKSLKIYNLNEIFLKNLLNYGYRKSGHLRGNLVFTHKL